MYYCIEWKNRIINQHSVIGYHTETKELGAYSGLFADKAIFSNKKQAENALKTLTEKGIENLEIKRMEA